MNEPFFRGYVRDNLEPELARAGFDVRSVEPAFLAKVAARAC